ncbi:MAG: glycosyltransferase [Pseudomonadota bacterium]
MSCPSPQRLLIYSHDTFGLGHLRRARAIAHALVEHRQDVSVLILSGSPLIGSYGFRSRVDFVKFPGVMKLKDGGYVAHGLDISIEDAIDIRRNIIKSAAETFRPHIFLVDKEPVGLRGEVEPTLEMLKATGKTRMVLGLRDILDDPETVNDEWERKGAVQAVEDYYDTIWVYGHERVCDPLAGANVPESVRAKMDYVGYLRRTVNPPDGPLMIDGKELRQPYLLVTTGGGGDGATLVDWVIRAYERYPDLHERAVIIFGPFLDRALQANFMARIERLPQIVATDFVPNPEQFMAQAMGVISMGGYNTVCEILSFDKPSVIVPRSRPRLEQTIRAQEMQSMGLLRMLSDADAKDPRPMAEAIASLAHQAPPSMRGINGLMGGFDAICSAVDEWTAPPGSARLSDAPPLMTGTGPYYR